MAGNVDARTGGPATGIAPIFDADKVQREIDAQVAITQQFSAEAPKAVASYGNRQSAALLEQAGKEVDPIRKAELESEAKKWQEGGAYRVALHTAVGAMSGGVAGAAGAAASASAAPMLDALQASIEQSLHGAGVGEGPARVVGQLVSGAAATAIGAAASGGSAAGTAMALGIDANNRQLHAKERSLIEKLAQDKAKAQCNGNSQCEKAAVLHWSDALERVAESLVDDTERARNAAYLDALAQASSKPHSEGAQGALESYSADLATARAMLEPYRDKPITGSAAQQTYFSATPEQRADPTMNTFLGQPLGPIAPLMNLRDAERLERFSAQNGAAQPVYPVEELMLGGAVAGRVAGSIARALNGGSEAVGTGAPVALPASESRALTTFHPPNNGAVGEPAPFTLLPGAQVDRFGLDGGRYLSPAGTPIPMRALAPTDAPRAYSLFEVQRPFTVEAGNIAPAYGQPGLGLQFFTDRPVADLIHGGYLKRVRP